MKYTMGVVVFLLCCCTASADFCIQSFNTYGPAYASQVKMRTQLLVELFNLKTDCEVFLFQEVWKKSHKKNLRTGLSSLSPEMSFYHGDESYRDVKTGLLMATNFNIQENFTQLYKVFSHGAADWFRDQLGVKKAFTASTVNVVDNGMTASIKIINTHLHHSSKVIRLAQILELYEYMNKHQSLPIIIAGDLNTTPRSLEWKLLTRVLKVKDSHFSVYQNYQKEDCTYCHDNPLSWGGPSRVLDYVFYRSGKLVELKATESEVYPKTFKGEHLSDHYGKKIRFQLKNKSSFQTVKDSAGIISIEEEKQVLKAVKSLFLKEKSKEFQRFIEIIESRLEELGDSQYPLFADCEYALSV
ncbi:MAG: endonuclease/exonuclease/phosphatase family protein [Bdellovibrionales bacterium]|nr:endonuclease/exonuclease/phosphatase family protein [Bdellovibrionales bacterium]